MISAVFDQSTLTLHINWCLLSVGLFCSFIRPIPDLCTLLCYRSRKNEIWVIWQHLKWFCSIFTVRAQKRCWDSPTWSIEIHCRVILTILSLRRNSYIDFPVLFISSFYLVRYIYHHRFLRRRRFRVKGFKLCPFGNISGEFGHIFVVNAQKRL